MVVRYICFGICKHRLLQANNDRIIESKTHISDSNTRL